MSEVTQYEAPASHHGGPVTLPAHDAESNRVWILRKHPRLSLRQAHAITAVDWQAGVARTSCGLELTPDAIGDVPAGGCLPCVFCVAATPLPAGA